MVKEGYSMTAGFPDGREDIPSTTEDTLRHRVHVSCELS